ncbi:HlyD family secretion protein [Thalassotalea mangrovi]|uniref:HlyD family secretion protein n=1 Tax=Thalassotalea mangrovi TaxID=2572245 RepID=A0A4U1B8Q4_9GAMM|nr:HlyD family secretion protein [Thalassotalea mangrovi]
MAEQIVTNNEQELVAGKAEATDNESSAPPEKGDLANRLTRIILVIAALYFVWYLISDRLTPITDQARVRGFVIPIVPEVSGQISRIHVGGDKPVKKGEVLFEIDPSDYQLAVEKAKAALEQAGQDVGASTANVASAKAVLEKAKANLQTIQENADRVFALEKQGIISTAQADETRGAVTQAELEIANAQAAYEQAQQQLGAAGEENPAIQSALSQLSEARLQLARTKVLAPSDGVVSYAKVNVGYYAAAGAKIMTFIATDIAWIEASYRENNLGNIKPGDAVDIVLDSAPGKIFPGQVKSVGYGVSFDKTQPGELSTPEKPKGWMRDPQRFIVVISFVDDSVRGYLREGGQADVITYTSDNLVLNGIGKFYMRLTSIFTYVN